MKYEAGIDGSDISCPLSAGVRVNGGVVGGIDLFVKDLEWSWTKTGEFQLFSQDLCALKPHIATTFLPDAQVGDAYSTQLELLDDRGGYWTLGTESPPGLTLSNAGLLSGTPTKAGSYDLPITFTDFDGLVAHATLTLVVKPNRVVVTTDSLPDGVVKMPYAATLQADGGRGPYTWTVLDGSVPGLVFHDDGSVTGEPTSAGSGTLHVKVVDADGLAGEGDVTWAVSELPPPVLGPVSGPITPPPSCGAACGTSWVTRTS